MARRWWLPALSSFVLFVAACGGSTSGSSQDAAGSSGSDELIVQAANYELVAGEDSRFIAGLLTPDQLFVSYGTVDIEFFYLGTRDDERPAEPGPKKQASFLAIEGGPSADGPVATTATHGRGVYATHVTFDRSGFWEAQVKATLEGEEVTGRAAFEVLDENIYPAVGEPAPRTANLTVDSNDAPPEAVDSRARDGEAVPDPELHQTTIADSIRRREPALVVFATPLYCISRFCGPVTDMVAGLERKYRNRANFIHIEVWREFDKTVVNKGAAEWIYRNDDLAEPWIYLIDGNGKIAARWDNVATRAEIEPLLKDLPTPD